MTRAILQGQMFIVCTIVVTFGGLPGAEAAAEEAVTVVIIGCCVVLCVAEQVRILCVC